MINPYIFREYDIRGVVTEDFTDDVVEALGKGFGTFVRAKGITKISLSGDIRLTSPGLKSIFKKGVLSTGVDVVDIGIAPTPVNYFSLHHLKLRGAVQITGSHNPPEFNGFKLTLDTGSVYGEAIQDIYKIIESGDFAEGEGEATETDVMPAYRSDVTGRIKLARPVKILTDCGNGAAGLVAPQILKDIGCDVDEIFTEPDGNFPNHHPDPTVEKNIEVLIKKVKEGDYDFGVGFDGDADRIGVVDNEGKIIWSDMLMVLYAEEILRKGSETIVFDVKCSQALPERIEAMGGVPVMYKTGHSLIKQKLKELGGKFGGEMSGHLFFADEYYGYDDAIYAACRLARLVSESSETLSEKVAALPKYYSTPELRLKCADDKTKFEITEKAIEYFTANYECSTIDGVRIMFGDGWGLARASNTQPVIVARFEAKSPERLEEIKETVISKLQEFGDISLD